MPKAALPNGVSLAYDVDGELTDPVVFVILGITDNITDWPAGLYDPLASNGFCVVRHELRDSGLSTKFDAYGPADLKAAKEELSAGRRPNAPYTAQDIAEDARLLLQHLDISSACIVGYSFGALVAQILALEAPQTASALVCLQGSNYNPALPPRSPGVEAAMLGATRSYGTTEEQIRAIRDLRMATNGSLHALDAREARDSAETSVSRMYCPEGTGRIILSRFASEPIYNRTRDIECPALILHGDEDPIFNIEHGNDMTARLPKGRLQILDGAGHNHPLSLQPVIASQLVEFVSKVL